jgi:type II secretory pathway component GspD/PulD (secretin)
MNPTRLRRSVALAVLLFIGSAAAHAQGQPRPQPAQQGAPQGGAPAEAARPPPEASVAPPIPAGPPLPTVSLESLVDRVARNSKKSFLIDSRAAQQVYLGSIKPEDVNYPTLLAILRANGMAATTIEGRVNIVPLFEIRSLAVPLVQNDDSSIPADEWVSRIVTTSKKEASSMVPILRPLLPGAAHLSAMCGSCEPGAQNCTNCRQLIVVDRYANVQRITAIVKMLDQQ